MGLFREKAKRFISRKVMNEKQDNFILENNIKAELKSLKLRLRMRGGLPDNKYRGRSVEKNINSHWSSIRNVETNLIPLLRPRLDQ